MTAFPKREEWHALSDGAALLAAAICAVIGLIWAVAGKDPGIVLHGSFFVIASAMAAVYLLDRFRGKAPPSEETGYADGVIRAGVIATLFWGIAGFLVGDFIAWQLAYPVLNLDLPWTSFGRLRPLHTSAVIFAFGGNALIASSFYVVQRTSRARLAGRWSPWFVFWGYQLFILIAATGYLLGVTQSKEYAEPEWYADIWLTIVWVVYFLVFIGTLARRREPHIYVANWFYLAFIVTIAMLHIINNLAIPVSFLGSKSYVLYSGVQDAMTQWWYGHNAVGFFLTAGFLGMMYYFVPKRAERPVYSYRLSIVHFWSLIFLYIWAGPHQFALHRATRLGADAWYDFFGDAVDAVVGRHDQRPHDAVGGLGQAQDGPRHPLPRGFSRLLRHGHLRGAVDEHQVGQCPVALHRLDHRACAFGRFGLGRFYQLRRDLLLGPVALGSPGTLFTASRRMAFLDLDPRHRALYHLDVGIGHSAGADVARL
jgi:hypothetical protein